MRKRRNYSELVAQFRREYLKYNKRTPFLIHFRWATHGVVADRTSHPFALRDGGAMIHNGIIDMPVSRKGQSDTEAFVAKFVNKLPPNWSDSPTLITAVDRMMEQGNKLCFLWPNKQYLILGENYGDWDKGVWYSNDSHKRKRSAWVSYTTTYGDESDYADWLQEGSNRYPVRLLTNGPAEQVIYKPGSSHIHSALCHCHSCEAYDIEHPEDEGKFIAWVVDTLVKRAKYLGGDSVDWAAPGAITSSLQSIVLRVKDSDGFLPPGVYVATKDAVWTVPDELADKNMKEIFVWYLRERGTGDPYPPESSEA